MLRGPGNVVDFLSKWGYLESGWLDEDDVSQYGGGLCSLLCLSQM